MCGLVLKIQCWEAHILTKEIPIFTVQKLEYVAREVRCNDRPFGGIQLVLCGDFLQLPPISRADNSGSEGQATFCFQSEAWDRCNFNCYELTVVHRQSDPVFIDILQNIRIGR